MNISSAVRAAAAATVVGIAVLAAGAGPAAATGAPDTGNTYPAFVVPAGGPAPGQVDAPVR